MFQTIVDYYSGNPTLFQVTVIILVLCVAIGAAVIIARKTVIKKRKQKETEQKAIAEMSNTQALPSDDVFDEADTEVIPSDEQIEEQSKEQTEEKKNIDDTDEEKENKTSSEQVPEKATEVKSGDESFSRPMAKDFRSAVNKFVPAEEVAPEKEMRTDKDENKEIERQPQDDPTEAEEDPEKTEPAAITEEDNIRPQRAKHKGKWMITGENGRFTATLTASNGEVLLRSESYTSLSGIKSGIDTINKNIAKNNFALALDKKGKYFFKLYSSSTRLLCVSEVYVSKARCESAIESVKRFAEDALVVVDKKENRPT